jgi:hypothetical protein
MKIELHQAKYGLQVTEKQKYYTTSYIRLSTSHLATSPFKVYPSRESYYRCFNHIASSLGKILERLLVILDQVSL